MSACLCIMVGNAEAERVFSYQNHIKSRLRTSLTVEHLDELMRISYAKMAIEQFPFKDAMTEFFSATHRHKYREIETEQRDEACENF